MILVKVQVWLPGQTAIFLDDQLGQPIANAQMSPARGAIHKQGGRLLRQSPCLFFVYSCQWEALPNLLRVCRITSPIAVSMPAPRNKRPTRC